MTQDQPQTPVTAPHLKLLRVLVHESTGLFFTDENLSLLLGKLSLVMREAGCDSLSEYYYFLREDDPDGTEFQRMINAVTVGETWFFREMDQLNALVASVIPSIHARRDTVADPVRIWSAACASGEEPLTLAMLIDAHQPDWAPRTRMLATDINTASIARATSGVFRQRSFRGIPPEMRDRYFRHDAGLFHIEPAILSRVTFRAGNLLDPDPSGAGGLFDLILCRNVLIYFDERSTSEAIRNFSRVLRPDGYLMIGSSESLLRYSLPWKLETIAGAFFYAPRDHQPMPDKERVWAPG